MSKTIELQNAGPVESLTVPVPEEGGVIIIRGMNDSGKSLSLEALQALLGGNQKIKKRYGSSRGLVEGLGATIKLMANARASGQCEAVSLEGELDIGHLIDPGLKEPVAADKARIKALLTVRGVKADLLLFRPLVESSDIDIAEFASDGTHASADLVDMAARLKKDFEAASRKVDDDAKTAEADARAKREVADSVDLDAESLSEILQGLLEGAIAVESAVKQKKKHFDDTNAKAEQAREKLDGAEASYEGPTIDEAEEKVAVAAKFLDAGSDQVATLRAALKTAEEEESRLETALEIATEKRTAPKHHQEAMAGWSETIESAANVEEVSDEDLSKAAASVDKARQAVENGVRIRDAKKALAEAVDLQGDADSLTRQADQLRDAAKGTNDVLAEAVKAGTLIPVTDDAGNFRFAVKSENDSDRRTYFHDLGPGRRTAIAVIEVASCLRDLDPEALKLALVVLPQPMWEGLDWEQRGLVNEHAKSLGVRVITAECDKDKADTGGIRVEVFEPTA